MEAANEMIYSESLSNKAKIRLSQGYIFFRVLFVFTVFMAIYLCLEHLIPSKFRLEVFELFLWISLAISLLEAYGNYLNDYFICRSLGTEFLRKFLVGLYFKFSSCIALFFVSRSIRTALLRFVIVFLIVIGSMRVLGTDTHLGLSADLSLWGQINKQHWELDKIIPIYSLIFATGLLLGVLMKIKSYEFRLNLLFENNGLVTISNLLLVVSPLLYIPVLNACKDVVNYGLGSIALGLGIMIRYRYEETFLKRALLGSSSTANFPPLYQNYNKKKFSEEDKIINEMMLLGEYGDARDYLERNVDRLDPRDVLSYNAIILYHLKSYKDLERLFNRNFTSEISRLVCVYANYLYKHYHGNLNKVFKNVDNLMAASNFKATLGSIDEGISERAKVPIMLLLRQAQFNDTLNHTRATRANCYIHFNIALIYYQEDIIKKAKEHIDLALEFTSKSNNNEVFFNDVLIAYKLLIYLNNQFSGRVKGSQPNKEEMERLKKESVITVLESEKSIEEKYKKMNAVFNRYSRSRFESDMLMVRCLYAYVFTTYGTYNIAEGKLLKCYQTNPDSPMLYMYLAFLFKCENQMKRSLVCYQSSEMVSKLTMHKRYMKQSEIGINFVKLRVREDLELEIDGFASLLKECSYVRMR